MDLLVKEWRRQKKLQQNESEILHSDIAAEHQKEEEEEVPEQHQLLLHLQPESTTITPSTGPGPDAPQPSSLCLGSLPLFLPQNTIKTTTLSAFPVSISHPSSSFPRMWGCFSLAQWQELELQAVIFKYMLAGAAVPSELLQPIKTSLNLVHSQYSFNNFIHHHPLHLYNSHYQSPLLQTGGYWGRGSMDPEPGRCRRTDGKKWRCTRDVVTGQKYCERHMHRGRSRSRKPVEITTPPQPPITATTSTTTTAGGGVGSRGGVGGTLISSGATHVAAASHHTQPYVTVSSRTSTGGSHFSFSGSSPSPSVDLLRHNHRYSVSKTESKGQYEQDIDVVSANGKSQGHVLRHFFDDWPRAVQDSEDNSGNRTATQVTAPTSLTISITGNPSSDVSLKLSTGSSTGNEGGGGPVDGSVEREQPTQASWTGMGWAANQMASMGGPLAEALRSSTNSNSSPTSVLHHQLPRRSSDPPQIGSVSN